jgi:hypothetical protein
VIISVGGKEAPQSLTKIEAAAYGGAPSAQGSRALDRGRDAISAVGRQSIAGSSAAANSAIYLLSTILGYSGVHGDST